MRVLWLTPTQLPAVRGLPPTGLGWIEGLRGALETEEPEVELTIASWGDVDHQPFRVGHTEYRCIRSSVRSGGRGEELLRRWSHSVVPPGAVEDCVRIADEVSPDVIHVHGSETFLGLALGKVRYPGVISLQGIASAYLAHWFDGLDGRDLVRVSADPAGLHGYGLLHDYARLARRARCEGRVFDSCRHYLGRTDWDRAVLESLRPGAHYHVVNEVLGSVYYEHEWKVAHSAPEVIYCTSGSRPVKGLEVLLEAVALLRSTRKRDVRLRVAGGVKKGSLWPVIRHRLKDPRLRGAVEILGVLKPGQVVEELLNAAVFVHPSHIDNSPNALCEALLVGVPCVASCVGGVPSLVHDGKTGLLYPDRDPFMLAAAVDRVLDGRDLAARLGSAARAAALQRHDTGSITHALVAAYREVIADAAA